MQEVTLFKKNIAAVHVANSFNLFQRKLINYLYYKASVQKKFNNRFYVSLKELQDYFYSSSNGEINRDRLKKSLEEIAEKKVTFNILGTDKRKTWGVTNFLADAIIEDGSIFYSLPATIEKEVLTPQLYTTINMESQISFNQRGALALWEFCLGELSIKKHYKVESPIIEVEKIRELLSSYVGTNNNSFYFFRRDVLEPAIKEIEGKQGSIKIKYETIKTGRKITHIKFYVETQNDREATKYFIDSLEYLYGNIVADNKITIENYLDAQRKIGKIENISIGEDEYSLLDVTIDVLLSQNKRYEYFWGLVLKIFRESSLKIPSNYKFVTEKVAQKKEHETKKFIEIKLKEDSLKKERENKERERRNSEKLRTFLDDLKKRDYKRFQSLEEELEKNMSEAEKRFGFLKEKAFSELLEQKGLLAFEPMER